MMNSIEQLSEVSLVLGSEKRTILLFVLKETPMSYTEIDRRFRRLNKKIGSSEIYKHLDILKRTKYIVKRGKVYLITLKGKTLIEGLEELVNVPAKAPKLQLTF